uniref:CONSTANS-like protein n=1 Tax=Dendrocalamus xishuangbannaensis TaxID=760221 RepID=D7NVX1_9POAL|nr:CONSTANS-like protein [Dendrocalamus xishuangbannaensis]
MNCNFSSNLFEQEAGGRSFPWTRPCDGCRAAPSVVYCRADAAYLCASCDTQVHSANHVASRHERVCVCEVCESAPAVLACRADAAALCTTCDAQVHSANPLAQRHQRVPVLPLPAAAIPAASGFVGAEAAVTAHGDKEEEEEVDSWLLLSRDSDDNNCTDMYFGNVDQYFDLVGYNLYHDNSVTSNPEEQYKIQEQQHVQKRYREKEESEYVVPLQVAMASEQQQSGYGIVGAEQAASMIAGVSAYTASISNSISFSSMDMGVVPDNNIEDISNTNILTTSGAMELLSGHPLQMPVHFNSMDREARVLRYKEKKRERKFEKTIRYATRKAYAEARPRIKGRFTKRSDIQHEVDHMFSSPALPDSSYGTVPWF